MSKKNKKLWGGRFQAETSELMDSFNASISFDWQLALYDIQGSLAHVQMLGRQGIIKKSEVSKIRQGLKSIQKKIAAGKFDWKVEREDVHLNIEAELIKSVGAVGGKLHTARSRNDQVATDLRLYCRDQVEQIIPLLRGLQKSLLDQAKAQIDTLLPGYTHLQRAQPVSLAHYFLAYFEMVERDVGRLNDALKRINVLPLGSGALAGTTFPIHRKSVAKELNFPEVSRNSLDAVSDRDFVVEILSSLSLIMTHLSRLAEEWILWASQEFHFIQLPEEFCTGSSMMPQKINPDPLELIRGKTGRVFGSLLNLLVVLKGLPLAYNKDLQEDKEPLFDAVETTKICLQILTPLVKKTRFHQKSMEKALNEGFVLATDLADYLSTKGVPFRKAHHLAGQMVAHCQKKGLELADLTLKDFKKFSPSISKDVFSWLDHAHAVDRRRSAGGTSRTRIRQEIKNAEKILKAKK